jgi:hypothetical protein
MEVLVLLQQAVLLDLTLGLQLVEEGLIALPQIGQFDILLGTQGSEGSLYLLLPLLHPALLLRLLQLENLLLDDVGLVIS